MWLFARPFDQFVEAEALGGLILLVSSVAALALANSPWRDAYHRLWAVPLSIGVGGQSLSLTLHQWINDGLMTLFFLLVGLEIKRELLQERNGLKYINSLLCCTKIYFIYLYYL